MGEKGKFRILIITKKKFQARLEMRENIYKPEFQNFLLKLKRKKNRFPFIEWRKIWRISVKSNFSDNF